MNKNSKDTENFRKAEFKRGIGDGDGTQKRVKSSARIRKEKRGKKLSKIRQRPMEQNNPHKNISRKELESNLVDYMKQVFSQNMGEVLKGLRGLLAICHLGDETVMKGLATQKTIHRLVQIASSQKNNCAIHADRALAIISNLVGIDVLLELFWTKTKIASIALNILKNSKAPLIVRKASVWVIANMMGNDDTKYRDTFIKQGVASALVNNLQSILKLNPLPDEAVEFRKDLCWGISNCYEGYNEPDFNILTKAGADKMLVQCLLLMEDDEVLNACTWALYNATNHSDAQRKILKNKKIIVRLCSLTRHRHYSVQFAAIKTLANLTSFPESGDSTFSVGDVLIECGIMKVLAFCLHHSANALKEEATFAANNLASGSPKHLNIMWKTGIMDTIIENAFQGVARVKNESIRCISTAFRASLDIFGEAERNAATNLLLSKDTLKVIAEGLTSPNGNVALDVMDCCYALVRCMKEEIISSLEDNGILDVMIELSMSATNSEVSTRAEEFADFLDGFKGRNEEDGTYDDNSSTKNHSKFLFESGDIGNFAQQLESSGWMDIDREEFRDNDEVYQSNDFTNMNMEGTQFGHGNNDNNNNENNVDISGLSSSFSW